MVWVGGQEWWWAGWKRYQRWKCGCGAKGVVAMVAEVHWKERAGSEGGRGGYMAEMRVATATVGWGGRREGG